MAQKILLFILLTISCLNISYSWDTTAAKFYPLAVGNKWSYRYQQIAYNCLVITQQYDYIITITDLVTKPNGKKYYQYSDGRLERIDSTTMNVYKYSGNSECLIDSLFAKIDDNFYSCRYTWTMLTQSEVTDTNSILFAGTQRKIKIITCNAMIGEHYYLMQGIGIHTHRLCEFGGMREFLNGCIINNVQYGNIVGTEINSSGVPVKSSLAQNYPNPFNPSTVIKYDVAKTVYVRIVVFNLQGKEIVKLVDEEKTPGTYKAEFSGESLASGIYFYRLFVEGIFIDSKKMVLLR